MSEVYHKTIQQLEERYKSVTKSESVYRAIEILKKKAAAVELCNTGAEIDIGANITAILKELEAAKAETGTLSNDRIMRIIVDCYLNRENFIKIDDIYQLPGIDAIYTFELYFNKNTVTLNRLPNLDPRAKHQEKATCHAFGVLPKLNPDSKIADLKILKKEFTKLRAHLKSTWEYIHVDKTPSITELSNLTDEDFE